ncbi:MAG: hypothetical protein GY715_16115 [Planctomycetes bacterium]|nr:hypothetical protein [Planctomycetota bacterium]
MEHETEPRPPGGDGAPIARSIPCARCGYDLRGLHVDGYCPECGFATRYSIQVAVDPASHRLPDMTNPRGVGNALLWLTVSLSVGTVLLLIRPAALRLDALQPPGAVAWSHWTPRWLTLVAAVIALAATRAVLKLAPPRGKQQQIAVWGDIWLMLLGLVACAGLAVVASLGAFVTGGGPVGVTQAAIAQAVLRVSLVASLSLTLLGLRGVFGAIGRRSREYRTAQGGRQGTRELIAAVIGIGAGEVLAMFGLTWHHEGLRAIGIAVIWISALMLVVGEAYLMLNAWWIRRSLRRPPPTYEELLTPPDEDT